MFHSNAFGLYMCMYVWGSGGDFHENIHMLHLFALAFFRLVGLLLEDKVWFSLLFTAI